MFNKQTNERVRQLEETVRALREKSVENRAIKDLLEGQIEKLVDQLSVLNDAHADLVTAHSSLLDAHREQAAALRQVREVQPVTSWNANVPLHVSEDEEEAQWQLENGLIDREMFNAVLEEAGLTPNIEFQLD